MNSDGTVCVHLFVFMETHSLFLFYKWQQQSSIFRTLNNGSSLCMESKIHESVFISNIISVGLSSVGCSSSSLGNTGNLRLGKGISQIIAQAHLRGS